MNKHVDSLLDLIENNKQNLKDNEYKKMVDTLKEIHFKSEPVELYEVKFLIIQTIIDPVSLCNHYQINHRTSYQKQKFYLPSPDFQKIKDELEDHFLHYICHCDQHCDEHSKYLKLISNYMMNFRKCDEMTTYKYINDDCDDDNEIELEKNNTIMLVDIKKCD